jgi:hypothetical protein
MTRPPPLPDLTKLSSEHKDELIVSLWRTIDAMEGGSRSASPASQATVTDLRSEIGRTGPAKRASATVDTGRQSRSWPGFLKSRLLLGVLIALGIGFAAETAIGWYQQHALDQRRQAALELENAAFSGLFIELTKVVYEADGKSYRATIRMQNANASIPLYILLDPARVFVQTGLTWQGVNAAAAPGTEWGVVKLDDTKDIQLVFQADVANWAELMPGYMHVRIESGMLISRSSEPRDDLVERANRFYIYLKPRNADDAAIKERMKFPGDPPVFIPMPPH